MITPEEENGLRAAINESRKLDSKSAHVVDYLFWQVKKKAAWYWSPLKKQPGVVDISLCA